MTPLLDLWLPILLSAAFAFIGSAIAWMAIPGWHNPDIKVLPDEKAFVGDVTKHDLKPGLYMWPNCNTGEEMKSDDFKNRWKDGPWGTITIPTGRPNFPKNLAGTFTFYLVVSAIVGFLASRAFGAGAEYWDVFTFVGLGCALSYCSMSLPGALYMMSPRRGMLTSLVDGAVFALLSAGSFAGFWPEAVSGTGL